MGDGIGGPVISCLSGNTFEMSVTHFRKDNKEEYEYNSSNYGCHLHSLLSSDIACGNSHRV